MTLNQKPIKVSVVIALKNEMGFIDKCVDSFLNQTISKDLFELLIYDGKSSDGSRDYLDQISKMHDNIHVFENEKEIAAAGWNLGFRKSQAEYVVLMGAHTFVAPDFIEKNLEIMKKHDVPCTGGRVIAIGTDKKSEAIALAFNHPFGAGNARYRYGKKDALVETVNFGFYKKSVVDAVPPINETIKRGEDWEYNYQIVQKFGKMYYCPEIISYYYSRSTFRQLWKRQYLAGKHKLEIVRKFPGSLLFRHIIPFFFALTLIVSALMIVLNFHTVTAFFLCASYLLLNILTSVYLAIKNNKRVLIELMVSFFIIQFAYGIGFFVGIFKLK